MAKEMSFQVDRRAFLLRPDRPPEGEERGLFDGEPQTEVNPAMRERAKGVGLAMSGAQRAPNTIRGDEAPRGAASPPAAEIACAPTAIPHSR